MAVQAFGDEIRLNSTQSSTVTASIQTNNQTMDGLLCLELSAE